MNDEGSTQLTSICREMNKHYRTALKHIAHVQPDDPEAYLVSLESFVLKAKLLETLLLQQQVTNAERLLQESQPSANAKDPHRERLETHVALLRREVQEKDRLIEKSLRSIHELTKNLETLLKNQIETENQRYE